jgi:serine protease Do
MTEENRKDLPEETPALREEEPREVVSYFSLPVEEPREVVLTYAQPRREPAAAEESDPWYMPREETDKAPALQISVGSQPEKRDVSVWREAAKKEKKRRRRGWWIALGCLALVGLVIGGIIWAGNRDKPTDDPLTPDEGDSASSIVDIFKPTPQTTIPKIQGDPAVRLIISDREGEELTAAEVYRKVNPSVVTVVAEQTSGASVGTGVIMTADGYILTNAHVISGGKSCWIALDTGVTYDVQLVGFDETEDLAVLKAVDARDLPAAEFGDSDKLEVGDKAYAIGNPLGVELRGTLTDGIISAVDRQIQVKDGTMTMLQTTAALNNGNSGGPLINAAGQIVGINTLKMSNTGWEGEATVEGLGFAIPMSSACFVVNDLIAKGEFEGVPTIGITVVTTRGENGETRLEVYSVEPGFGAVDAGVQEGDIILAADGQPITQTSDLLKVRRSHVIGDTIVLTVLRGEETLELPVVLYSNKGR